MKAWWEAKKIVRKSPVQTPPATRFGGGKGMGDVRHFSTQARRVRILAVKPSLPRATLPYPGTHIRSFVFSKARSTICGSSVVLQSSSVRRFASAYGTARSASTVASVAETSVPHAADVSSKGFDSVHSSVGVASALVSPAAPTLSDVYGAEDVPLVIDHLSHWWSVIQMQDLITWMHTTAELPWWSSIAAATILLRLLAMPFEVVMLRNSLRMKQILPDIESLQTQMAGAATLEEKQVHAQALMQLFKEKHLFGATHNLALAEPTMTTGGALWYVDLVLPDPTWMLPVASSLTWLMLLEMTAGSFYLSNQDFRSFCRTLAVAFIPVVANMPAGVFCFWLTSNVFSMLRVIILNHNSMRHGLGIPLRHEIAALAHVPRPMTELLNPMELRALVKHAKQLAKYDSTPVVPTDASSAKLSANSLKP